MYLQISGQFNVTQSFKYTWVQGTTIIEVVYHLPFPIIDDCTYS